MNKRDKQWIKDTFRELITEALTVEIEMVQKRDHETGQPLTTPKHIKKSVYLPAHWVEFLPFYEQAIVAAEVSSEQARNRAKQARDVAVETSKKIDTVGKLYLDLERPLQVLAAFSDHLQGNQITMNDHVKLVYKKNEGNTK